MPDIQQIELEREGGHGEQPIDDPPPAEHPEETLAESEAELQTRASKQAFERAIVRLSTE